ncbi:MAG TPA: ion transporter [Chitinophagaceae bacterium]|jgi:voltage-gated potassium channel|nr:ion transporter [Chitinophagaceae bacterium]
MYQKTKHKVHILLHPELGQSKADKAINIFIITLIVLNVIAVMMETVKPLYTNYQKLFDTFDMISVIIFSIEYVLRVWSCTDDPKYKGSIKGRIKYMLSPGALIDLLAFLPTYFYAFLNFDLRILRLLRFFRFFRLFRLTAYTRSAQMIFNVFRSRVNELLLSLTMVLFLIIIASCLLYFAEHNAQPDDFSSIPATIWWAVVTLTTTGYGDMAPITSLGKILAGTIMLTGVALFALPAGIITVGFLEEFRAVKKYKGQNCPHCGKPLDEPHQHEA